MVSYLGQEPPEAQPFPVLDVVLLGRYAHHGRFARETSADRERAHRSLEYVGLSGFEHRPYTELSGGERQLVLFARILAQETDLLLLDEPTANLDIRHQDLFFSMLWELAREGKGALVSVHNLNVASQYCSRLVLLDKGRVVAEGRAEDVLRPDLLDPVYGAATVVSPSPGTGSLTVAVLPRGPKNGAGGRRIHLIGGAGSAVNPTRALARLGYDLSAGIAHEYDADEALWRTLGVPRKTVGAFSRIHAEDVRAAQTYVESAELVILCSFPVGPGNLENLRLAARARRLVIVVPGPGDLERSFFSQEARDLFEALPPHALRVSYRELVADLESGRFWEESTPEA
jgi:iron complex transport system ATP-binding protein